MIHRHPRTNIVQRSAVSAIACELRSKFITPRQAAEQMRKWAVPLHVALRIVREHA